MRIIGNNPAADNAEITAIASGTLPSGQPVVVNADGTVSVVGSTVISDAAGTPVVYDAGASQKTGVTFDSNSNKVVVAYTDINNSYYGTAIVGTVDPSDNSISFGSEAVFESASTNEEIGITFDSNSNKVVIAYNDAGNSNRGTAIVGTLSGTDISFGSAAVFETGATIRIAATFDSNSNKVVISFADGGNSYKGKSVVGTISGTSISFGSVVQFEAGTTNYISSAFDSVNNKVIIAYQDSGDSNKGKAVVATVNNTAITFGDAVIFETGRINYTATVYDTNAEKTLILYADADDSNHGKGVVGTVSNTAISFGTIAKFEAALTKYIAATFDSNINKVVVSYQDTGNSDFATAVAGTISGTSVSFSSAFLIDNTDSEHIVSTFDSNSNKVVTVFADKTNTNDGTAVVIQASGSIPNLTAENFIGFANSAASDGGTAKVQIGSNISSVNTDLIVTGFDLANAVYDSVSFLMSSQASEPIDIKFKSDGTKLYMLGGNNDIVFEYNLSTAYDLTTAAYNSVNLNISSQETTPAGIEFSSDGTKMYVVGTAQDKVFQYTLTTAWDLSTASYASISFSISQDTNPVAVTFNADGTKMYVAGATNEAIFQYSLSTAYTVSSASYDSVSLSTSGQGTDPYAIVFNADGTKLFALLSSNRTVFQYALTTGFNLSTASYADISFSVNSQDGTAVGLTFKPDGLKMYITGDSSKRIHQYTTGSVFNPAMTAGQQYFVQTNGRLGLTADDPSVIAGTAVSATDIIVKG
jgi:hypothetical protein